jgi:LPXTG-motif cell wall-anchored protein
MKRLITAATAALALSLVAGTASADETNTIAENASADEQFSTLVAALTAADLVVTAEDVLANTELLTTILTYHVVSGEVPAATVVTLDSATTLQGEDVTIAVEGDSVVLNGSVNVVATDVANCNGIIHVIDGVLLPPSVAASLTEATTTDMPTTGSDAGTLTLLAAGLVGAGALGLLGTRRVRTARVTDR